MSRTRILLIVCGLLLGIVLYYWQLSLIAFNSIVAPAKPIRLWSIEITPPDKFDLEILGKKCSVTFPGRFPN
jgi:hypothetical protein